jgi:hypothetical protein
MKHDIKSIIIGSITLFLLTGCPSDMWIAVNGIERPAVARGHVIYLESPPQRPYVVIGIMTPETGEYSTEAEAVKNMLELAAKKGGDAIFIESQSEHEGWKFGTLGGVSGGSFSEMRIRAKAIVWK